MPTMASGMGVWIAIFLECVKKWSGMNGGMVGMMEGDLNVKQKLLYTQSSGAMIWDREDHAVIELSKKNNSCLVNVKVLPPGLSQSTHMRRIATC